MKTARAIAIESRATAMIKTRTTPELFQLLELAAGDTRKVDVMRVVTWVRGELIERNVCPDCRGELDEDVFCIGCPR